MRSAFRWGNRYSSGGSHTASAFHSQTRAKLMFLPHRADHRCRIVGIGRLYRSVLRIGRHVFVVPNLAILIHMPMQVAIGAIPISVVATSTAFSRGGWT